MIEKTVQKTEVHTCCNCGKTGTGMIGNYYWVGGQGDVLFYECRDCLDARWEASKKACEALKKAMEAISGRAL